MRAVILLVSLGASACASLDKPNVSPLARALGAGWACFKSPSDLFAQGTVFSVDNNGTYFVEAELEIPITSKRARFRNTLQERVHSANFTSALLGQLNQELPSDLEVSAGHGEVANTADIKIRRGIRRKGYSQASKEAEIWALENADALAELPLQQRELFVVRSTFASGDFDYTLNRVLKPQLVQYRTQLAEPVVHDTDDPYVLSWREGRPINLCMLAERVPLESHGQATVVTVNGLPEVGKIVDRRQFF